MVKKEREEGSQSALWFCPGFPLMEIHLWLFAEGKACVLSRSAAEQRLLVRQHPERLLACHALHPITSFNENRCGISTAWMFMAGLPTMLIVSAEAKRCYKQTEGSLKASTARVYIDNIRVGGVALSVRFS